MVSSGFSTEKKGISRVREDYVLGGKNAFFRSFHLNETVEELKEMEY